MTRALVFIPLTVLLATGAAQAQAPQAAAPAAPATAPAATSLVPDGAPGAQPAAKAMAAEAKADAVEAQGFTYNPEGRRDPFVSLLRRGVDSSQTTRVAGLAGLGTAEVSLRGVVLS